MKRGGSGLSFVVGVDKPQGLTSHDVVNRCRRIFGEGRVGHTGTLDPLASGAMAVCVGPATKLSNYLTFHDKEYLARIVFGAATDTDDSEGEVLRRADIPACLRDAAFARKALAGLVGAQTQLPPAFSAKKVGGVKAYEAARRGTIIELRPVDVEVHSAELVALHEEEGVSWDVRFHVSAGTYIRSLARDLGRLQGTYAHLGGLRRLRSGALSVAECISLETLEANPGLGRIDPIGLLGIRYLVPEGATQEKAARNGGKLGVRDLVLYECGAAPAAVPASSPCTPQVAVSTAPLRNGETVGVLSGNKLIALYEYDSSARCLKPRCGFAQGVTRGIV